MDEKLNKAAEMFVDSTIKDAGEDNIDSFATTPVENMSRRERRDKLKYFSKMLKDHEKTKPRINLAEEDEEKQQLGIIRMQRWATRYGILSRKIQELGSKRNSKRNNKPS